MLSLGLYNIDLNSRIAKGSFGVVYNGSHKKRHFNIAAKQCELKESEDGKIHKDKRGELALLEIKNWQELKHPHIVELYDYHFKDNSFWMIMEFCEAGSLDTYVCANNPNLSELIDIMYQSASAIHYMHSKLNPTVHRDVKPTNILMMRAGSYYIAKIADLGLAKTVELSETARTLIFSSKCGTYHYTAPELFMADTHKFGKYVDIFALGLVFLAIISHRDGESTLKLPTGNNTP